MKLSIITINYNNCEGLQRTIDSIVTQIWRDFEWIIVDGGSTDGSRELIERYANFSVNEKVNIAWWCSEPDKGIYNAMNKGVRHATGEYLLFLNSGDELYDATVLREIFYDRNYSEDILYGNCQQVYADHTRDFIYPDNISLYYLYHRNICQQAMFVRTSLLQDEGFDESFYIYADWARWIKAALQDATFIHINSLVCKYDMAGVSSQKSEKQKDDYRKLYSLYPNMVLPLIHQIDEYEGDILIQRVRGLLRHNRVSNFVLRGVIKVLVIMFHPNNYSYKRQVWNEAI